MTHCLNHSVCTGEKVLCPHVQFVFQKLKWICRDGESKLVDVGDHGTVSTIWVCMKTVPQTDKTLAKTSTLAE